MPQAIEQHNYLSRLRKLIDKIILAFSLKSNLKKLTSSRKARVPIQLATTTNIQQICSLDFLRVISTLWIIIIHSYSFALSWMRFDDTESKRNLYKSLPSQFLANGTFSVDNFFLMSGFLTFMRNLEEHYNSNNNNENNAESSVDFLKNRFKRFLKFSLFRYARLVPLMMLMIFLSILLLPQLSGGQDQAKWLIATQMFDHWCRLNWPIDLLLAHNFFQTSQMCFSHSWYVAVDFQLFLIFQLFTFLFNIHLFKQTIIIFSLLIISLGQLTSMLITYSYDLPAIPLVPAKSQQAILDFYKFIYIKPFHWASSYFVGILLAKLMLDYKLIIIDDNERDNGKNQINRFLKNKNLRISLKLISIVLIVCLIFSNYFHFQQESPMSRNYASLYSLLARPIWSLCVATLIALAQTTTTTTATTTKAKSKTNSLSSTKRRILSTLSRLSYSVYLLHPVQMATFYGNRLETFQFSHYLLLYFTIGNILLTYFGATILYLFIELPIQNLFQQTNNSNKNNKRETRIMQTRANNENNKSTGNRLSGQPQQQQQQYELRSIEFKLKRTKRDDGNTK